jgi:hypothetical protein
VTRLLKSAGVLSLAVAAAFPQTQPGAGEDWPREIAYGADKIVIYQPQADAWKKNRLEARSAVTVTEEGAAPVYGIVNISARTDVDKEDRMVTLEDLKVTSASFPSEPSRQSGLLRVIRESLPQWPTALSLDRLLADLAITDAQMETDSVALKNTPPKIIYSTTPSVLIRIDGEPVYRSVQGTPYTHVINTPALLLFDSSAGRFYLDGGNLWMTATSLNGPWRQDPNPPPGLDQVKAQLLKTEEKDPHNHSHQNNAPPPKGPPPTVYVSTQPAELLQTRGEPQFAPIEKTSLSYVTNTNASIFMDVKTQRYYTLLSGRWFESGSLNGPWAWIAGDKLPGDFKHIPPDSPKAAVLASIPGTEQAREAVIADQIPQTATVKRSEAHLHVRYDGQPKFQPIEGTSMEYAVNTATDVIHAEGQYYAVHNAVWFVANSPFGPWAVADYIPSVIYTIPPSCPLFHDRYVYVYGATPDYVYEGYTPGYMGAYVADNVVVFGTGWDYPAWTGDFYFGWPWTWGFGWQFGYWGGGWFGPPMGWGYGGYGGWWYHNPWYMHRVYGERWNPHWYPGDAMALRNNVNIYNRWSGNTVLARSVVHPMAVPAMGRRGAFAGGSLARSTRVAPREDLYAGRDGRVYQYRQNNWFQRTETGRWNRVAPNRGLEMQRQARAFGTARMNEYHRFGGFSGMSRGGFASMPRSMPHFGGFGGGMRGMGGMRR